MLWECYSPQETGAAGATDERRRGHGPAGTPSDSTFVAAGITYYWLVSLIPIVGVAFAVLQAVYGDALVEWVVANLRPVAAASGESATPHSGDQRATVEIGSDSGRGVRSGVHR